MMDIDLNADLGEGAGFDAELMPLITSANVCCGLHAGGPVEIAQTLRLAASHGTTIGAHPSYADREHFGRREMTPGPDEVISLCLYQLGAIAARKHSTPRQADDACALPRHRAKRSPRA